MAGFEGAPATAIAAGTRLGRYELVRLLGSGSWGAVYQAVHVGIARTVAIKVVDAGTAARADARARLLRKVQLLSRIDHPHIVEFVDLGTENGLVFVVMEYLDGETLSDYARRTGPLSIDETVDLMLPAIAAVDAIHEAGTVHGSLSARNLFLCRLADGTLYPKVTDFAIANAAGAADHYALGAMVYQCVAGRADVPAGFSRVIDQSMSSTAESRFATVRDMGQALLAFASPATRAKWEPSFGAAAELAVSELHGELRSSPVPVTDQMPAKGGAGSGRADTVSLEEVPWLHARHGSTNVSENQSTQMPVTEPMNIAVSSGPVVDAARIDPPHVEPHPVEPERIEPTRIEPTRIDARKPVLAEQPSYTVQPAFAEQSALAAQPTFAEYPSEVAIAIPRSRWPWILVAALIATAVALGVVMTRRKALSSFAPAAPTAATPTTTTSSTVTSTAPTTTTSTSSPAPKAATQKPATEPATSPAAASETSSSATRGTEADSTPSTASPHHETINTQTKSETKADRRPPSASKAKLGRNRAPLID